jgi:hypothetical protein
VIGCLKTCLVKSLDYGQLLNRLELIPIETCVGNVNVIAELSRLFLDAILEKDHLKVVDIIHAMLNMEMQIAIKQHGCIQYGEQ